MLRVAGYNAACICPESAMSNPSRSLTLIARPDGVPRDEDFALRTDTLPALTDSQFRVAVRYLSIDPAMRVWMSEQKSYWPPVPLGEVMRAAGDRKSVV